MNIATVNYSIAAVIVDLLSLGKKIGKQESMALAERIEASEIIYNCVSELVYCSEITQTSEDIELIKTAFVRDPFTGRLHSLSERSLPESEEG